MPHALSPLTDAQAIRRVLDGDVGAFAVLVERHSPAVFALLSRHVSHAEQEEIAQEGFLLAFERLSSLGEPESFRTWLLALTLRCSARFLRRASVRREVSLERSGPGSGEDRAWLLEESRQRHESAVLQRENKSLVALLMAHLKPEDRTVVELFYAKELKLTEIAAMLGWSEVKVKVRLHRAKKRMAQKMRALRLENCAGW